MYVVEVSRNNSLLLFTVLAFLFLWRAIQHCIKWQMNVSKQGKMN